VPERVYRSAKEYMDANYPPLPDQQRPRRRPSIDREPLSDYIERCRKASEARRSRQASK